MEFIGFFISGNGANSEAKSECGSDARSKAENRKKCPVLVQL